MTNITPAYFQDAIRDISRRQIVPLSGGKDSTALAIYLSQNYAAIRFEFVFCDTGAELPETYDYLTRLEYVLGCEIKRISALELLQLRAKPGRTAFDVMLYEHFAGFLPSVRSRWCTRMLKIHPYEQFIGSDPAYSYIAIRADEDRAGYTGDGKPVLLSEQPNIVPVYPFKDQGLRLPDIQQLLDDSGLGAPRYYEWRSRSGCYFCFYQQIAEWQGLKERHPELFEKAKTYEQTSSSRGYTWVDGRSLADLETLPRREMKPKRDDAGCAICHL